MLGLFLVIFALLSPAAFALQSKLATVTWTFEDGFQLQDDRLHMSPDSVAWANFTNQVNSTGWSYLEVQTSDQFPDKIQVDPDRIASCPDWKTYLDLPSPL